MDNQLSYYRDLLKRYLSEDISEAEANELFDFIRNDRQRAIPLLQESEGEQYSRLIKPHPDLDPAASDRMRSRLLQAINSVPFDTPEEAPLHNISFKRKRLGWVAAASLIVAITGTYFLFLNKPKPEIAKAPSQAERFKNDIAPGGNKAILKLGNGSTIVLDSVAEGTLARQGDAKITKLTSGLIAYNELHEKPTEVFFNTLYTPRGGQYQLRLPDGSMVWLNAASSITYPTAFVGNDRTVEITGEAYFEVAKDKSKPFHVKVNDMEVDVLGTHFNINAYPEETAMKTTLLEGSVKIISGNRSKLLEPGQQAQVGNDIELDKAVDLDQVMAWKNGLFNFNHADLNTVMRQLARWYDIDVKYEGHGPAQSFHGKITRDLNLSQVLKLLQDVEVKFRIEGKTLIVTS